MKRIYSVDGIFGGQDFYDANGQQIGDNTMIDETKLINDYLEKNITQEVIVEYTQQGTVEVDSISESVKGSEALLRIALLRRDLGS